MPVFLYISLASFGLGSAFPDSHRETVACETPHSSAKAPCPPFWSHQSFSFVLMGPIYTQNVIFVKSWAHS